MSDVPPRRHPLHSRLSQIVAVLVILSVVLFLLLPTFSTPRSFAHRSNCRNNLKQLEIALHNYHDVYGSFPPAVIRGPDGTPWHSWRVLILPQIEGKTLYSRYNFNEPWNSPHNQQLAAEVGAYPYYHCPADSSDPSHTSYLAVVGERTLWPPDEVVNFAQIPDGTSNTLHLIEVAESGIHWMEPRDLVFDDLTFTPGVPVVRSPHGGATHWFKRDDPRYCNAAFADGSVRGFDPAADPQRVRQWLLRDDGLPPVAP